MDGLDCLEEGEMMACLVYQRPTARLVIRAEMEVEALMDRLALRAHQAALVDVGQMVHQLLQDDPACLVILGSPERLEDLEVLGWTVFLPHLGDRERKENQENQGLD